MHHRRKPSSKSEAFFLDPEASAERGDDAGAEEPEPDPEGGVQLYNGGPRTGDVEDEPADEKLGVDTELQHDQEFLQSNAGELRLANLQRAVSVVAAGLLIMGALAFAIIAGASVLAKLEVTAGEHFLAAYESEADFAARNAWRHTLEPLQRRPIFRDPVTSVQIWIAQWRISGEARWDASFGAPQSESPLAAFDAQLRNYTARHGFGCSAFAKPPLKAPVPKVCGCTFAPDHRPELFYFPSIVRESAKFATVFYELHYLPEREFVANISTEIVVRYTDLAMAEIFERKFKNADVHCFRHCVEITDNVDYLTDFLPRAGCYGSH